MANDDYRPPQQPLPPIVASDASAATASSRGPGLGGRIFIFFFGLIFFSVGCGIVWNFGIKTLLTRSAAQSWPTVQAIVERSEVATHSGDDSTTYGPSLLYRYTYEGKAYKSSHYNINKISSSDYGAAQRVVDRYPVGATVTAYVNPADPYYAIMVREGGAGDYFGFVFILFCFFGGIMMMVAFSKDLKLKAAGEAVNTPKPPLNGNTPNGPVWR